MCSAFGSSISVQGWQQRTARRAGLSQSYRKTGVLTFRKSLLHGQQTEGELLASEEEGIFIMLFLKVYDGHSRTAKLSCSTDHESAWCSSPFLHL